MNKNHFVNGWLIFSAFLIGMFIRSAYVNIHTGDPQSRLSPWNWGWMALAVAIVIGARSYQYFKQGR